MSLTTTTPREGVPTPADLLRRAVELSREQSIVVWVLDRQTAMLAIELQHALGGSVRSLLADYGWAATTLSLLATSTPQAARELEAEALDAAERETEYPDGDASEYVFEFICERAGWTR